MRDFILLTLFAFSVFGQTIQSREVISDSGNNFAKQQKMFTEEPKEKIVYDSGIGLSIKYLKYDESVWNDRRPHEDLPSLPKTRLKLYGLYAYSYYNDWLSIGLTGHVAVLRKENDFGKTRLSGVMGGVIIEANKVYDDGLLYVAGVTLSTNLFDFTSMVHNGQGVNSSSLGFAAEPMVGLGYVYEFFTAKAYYAYQIGITSLDVQNGPIDDKSVLLSGGQWCANIAFNIPQKVSLETEDKWELIPDWKKDSR